MASKSRESSPKVAPLLHLPLELRNQIYAYLLPRENVSHPLPSVGITSVSHRPPSKALLSIHPTITDEILDYFYSISTWYWVHSVLHSPPALIVNRKLVFSHAFNFFRVDPELRCLGKSPILSCIRKVEVVFFCDVLLLQSYPSFGLELFCAEIRKRASRACDVLNKAPKLRVVVVSWCDSTYTGNWEEKAKILTPLGKLIDAEGREGPVSFQVGTINGPMVLEQWEVAAALRDIIGAGHRIDYGNDGMEDASQSLRMLAFDPRQERHQLSPKAGSYPMAGTTRKGLERSSASAGGTTGGRRGSRDDRSTIISQPGDNLWHSRQ